MQIDPSTLLQQDVYKLLIGTVVPRPIAWVSTISEDGVANLAPYSFFNVVGSNPPALSVSMNYKAGGDNRKDSLRNTLATGEFVVNIVNEPLAHQMNMTGVDFPAHISEFERANLEAAASVLVRPPRVASAPVSFECKLIGHLPVGDGPGSSTLVVGEIVMIHIDGDLVDSRYRVDLQQLQPIGRLAGADYARIRETFAIQRGTYNRETGEVDWPK